MMKLCGDEGGDGASGRLMPSCWVFGPKFPGVSRAGHTARGEGGVRLEPTGWTKTCFSLIASPNRQHERFPGHLHTLPLGEAH